MHKNSILTTAVCIFSERTYKTKYATKQTTANRKTCYCTSVSCTYSFDNTLEMDKVSRLIFCTRDHFDRKFSLKRASKLKIRRYTQNIFEQPPPEFITDMYCADSLTADLTVVRPFFCIRYHNHYLARLTGGLINVLYITCRLQNSRICDKFVQ